MKISFHCFVFRGHLKDNGIENIRKWQYTEHAGSINFYGRHIESRHRQSKIQVV